MAEYRTPRRLCSAILVFIAMIAALPSGPTYAETYTHQFQLEGPFPIQQHARLRVDELLISISDFYSSGEARFRFRFDVSPCDWQYPVDEVSIFPPNAPLADCPYEFVKVRELEGLTANIFGVPHAVNVVLPEDQPATISRYQSGLLRARVFARELDLLEDDQLGGAIGAFSYRSNFGAGGDPTAPSEGAHGFGLNETALQIAANGFYAGEFKISVAPVELPVSKHLEVWQVWGTDDRCEAGQPFTFGVKMRNPENIVTEPYAVAIGRLDPDTNTFTDMWNSPALPGMGGPDYQGDPTPVTLTLGRGPHRLAAFAPGHANAVEFDIRCDLTADGLTDIAPGVFTEPTNERTDTAPGILTDPSLERPSPRLVSEPTATSTPVSERSVDPGPRLVAPTATSTPGLTVPGRGPR